MRRWKRLSAILTSLCLVFLLAAPVHAADTDASDGGDTKTYVIRLFSGEQGTIKKGRGDVWVQRLPMGTQVNFSRRDITLTDSKYYIKGFRVSGKDVDDKEYVRTFNTEGDATGADSGAFTVNCDRDYVVSYGILMNATSYTVHYQDADGRTLADSETYYGNVGDKPVVAYLYIEGYRPQAYNLTRTLKKDASENVFTFVYVPDNRDNGTGTGPGGTDSTGGTGTAGGGTGAGGTGAGANGTGAAGTGGGEAGGDEGLTEAPDENTPLAEEPALIQDLDEEVPLAGMLPVLNIVGDARLLGVPVPVVIASGLVLLGGGWYLIVMKKRKKKEEES